MFTKLSKLPKKNCIGTGHSKKTLTVNTLVGTNTNLIASREISFRKIKCEQNTLAYSSELQIPFKT